MGELEIFKILYRLGFYYFNITAMLLQYFISAFQFSFWQVKVILRCYEVQIIRLSFFMSIPTITY